MWMPSLIYALLFLRNVRATRESTGIFGLLASQPGKFGMTWPRALCHACRVREDQSWLQSMTQLERAVVRSVDDSGNFGRVGI